MWADDFDGPAGTPPSPDCWSAELGAGGWGDEQLQVYMGASFDAGVDLSADFHVYAVDWTADRITWSLDGAPYHSLARADVPEWVFDHDFYLLLNLAIGGSWPGNALDERSLPASMLVDYVSATQASAR